MKEVLTRIAWKNHKNGALNPRAQFRKEVAKDVICNSPLIAGQLGIFDCSGVSDGSAAALIVRAEDAHKYTDKPLYVKALSFVAGPAAGPIDPTYDYTTFLEVVRSRRRRLPAGRHRRTRAPSSPWPRCTTASRPPSSSSWRTSASPSGAWAGRKSSPAPSTSTASSPVNPDGGLKSFGHPIGASGLRMLFECWLQLRGEAGERQISNGKTKALTHNLGGAPGECVSFVSVVGSELD